MAYNAQAGSIPAYYPQGGASRPDASGYEQYQPYQYQPYGSEPPVQQHAAAYAAEPAYAAAGAAYPAEAPYVPEAGTAPAVPGRAGRFAGMLGAAASLALIAGVGIWSYELISRDVSGVPVVRAAEGPMRIQPESPGGEAADHQGLAVNAVAATGGAEAPAERLVLAPQDVTLTADDQPLTGLTGVETLAAPLPPSERIAEAPEEAFQQGQIDALVAELTAGATPLEPLAEVQPAAAETVAAAVPAIVQPAPLEPVRAAAAVDPSLIHAPGVSRSLRPSARPASFARQAPASAAAASSAAVLDVEAASLPAGTRLAQLGAYESAEVARSEWDRIQGRFPDFLDGKQRVIQRAESGGRIFYRLRVMGFNDLADARRFCSALVAGRADCIPVTTR